MINDIKNNRDQILNLLNEIIIAIEISEYNINKIKQNKEIYNKITCLNDKLNSFRYKLNIDGKFIDFNSLATLKKAKLNIPIFGVNFLNIVLIFIFILMLIIYLIESYISTPGLSYSHIEYNRLKIFSNYCFIFIGLSILIFFINQKYIKKKTAKYTIYDYVSFLRKLKNKINSMPKHMFN